jgi:5-methylcytosine-specific restriction enzyme subunit McrC
LLSSNNISVFEHGWLVVGQSYNGVLFEEKHLKLLAQYLTLNPKACFYTLYYNRVRFTQYVGIIRVGELTIEVLPKTDKHQNDQVLWQNVLLQMLAISLQVESKVTTAANISIKKRTVLEAYLQMFLDQVDKLLHEGLVKKYRQNNSNQTALKGKLKIHQHITKNLVHAERFYVQHQVYDRDNIYNAILQETLKSILALNVSYSASQHCSTLLLHFPKCTSLAISEKLFQRISYDRKTERYRTAIELARIILLNYHPDIKGGSNNILAIMFDMNLLWENYVYYILKRSLPSLGYEVSVQPQQKMLYWQHADNWNLRLKPDLVLKKGSGDNEEVVIIDSKWKFQSDTSIEDIRQMDAYGNYFKASKTFLLYPDKIEGGDKVISKQGSFYRPGTKELSSKSCGLLFVDLLKDNELNKEIGEEIIEKCFS